MGQRIKKMNFFKSVATEMLKLKNSPLWYAVLILPILSIFLGSSSYFLNQEALIGNSWNKLWTQVALFYGYFFYPILLSIVAAYLWRIEHTGSNWNWIKTLPVNVSEIWFSKLTILFLIAITSQVLMIALYIFSGFIILKFTEALPFNTFWYLFAGPICIMASASLQLYLSLRIKSLTIPIGICFLCCFIGLFCYLNGFWIFPDTIAIIGINAVHENVPTFTETLKVFSGTLFWITFTSFLGTHFLKKMEL